MSTEQTFKNQEDELEMKFYSVDPLDPQKRLRVWTEQQMNDVLKSLQPDNYLTEFVRFLKGCDNLSRCYKNHEDLGHINEIRIDFWSKYQYIIKVKIKPVIKKIRKMEIKKDLDRMRFL